MTRNTWSRDRSTAAGGGLSTARGGGLSTASGGGASTSSGGGMSTSSGGGLSTSSGGWSIHVVRWRDVHILRRRAFDLQRGWALSRRPVAVAFPLLGCCADPYRSNTPPRTNSSRSCGNAVSRTSWRVPTTSISDARSSLSSLKSDGHFGWTRPSIGIAVLRAAQNDSFAWPRRTPAPRISDGSRDRTSDSPLASGRVTWARVPWCSILCG